MAPPGPGCSLTPDELLERRTGAVKPVLDRTGGTTGVVELIGGLIGVDELVTDGLAAVELVAGAVELATGAVGLAELAAGLVVLAEGDGNVPYRLAYLRMLLPSLTNTSSFRSSVNAVGVTLSE